MILRYTSPLHLSLDTVHCFSNCLRVIPFLTLSDGNSRHSSDSIKNAPRAFWVHYQTIRCFFGCIIKQFGILGCAPYGRRLKEQSNGIFVLSTFIHYSGINKERFLLSVHHAFPFKHNSGQQKKSTSSAIKRRRSVNLFLYYQ